MRTWPWSPPDSRDTTSSFRHQPPWSRKPTNLQASPCPSSDKETEETLLTNHLNSHQEIEGIYILRVRLQMASMPLWLPAYQRIFDPPDSLIMYGNKDCIVLGKRSKGKAFTISAKGERFTPMARDRRRGWRHRVSPPPNNNSSFPVLVLPLIEPLLRLFHQSVSRFISYACESSLGLDLLYQQHLAEQNP